MDVSGGRHTWISNRIKAFGIDTSHFLGQAHARGSVSTRKKPPHDILCFSRERVRASLLRRAMLESGVVHQCDQCDLTSTWMGKAITLEIDHIDGNPKNNTLANLRFLCPNCHSQCSQTNASNKNLVTRRLNSCSDCGKSISKPPTERCKSCAAYRKNPTKIQWPHRDDLIDMVAASNMSAVARSLGVSDTAVKKRLIRSTN